MRVIHAGGYIPGKGNEISWHRKIIISNASGGLKDYMEVSDLMILRDSYQPASGNPLRGPHNPDFGLVFRI